jgi:hypothetical protein
VTEAPARRLARLADDLGDLGLPVEGESAALVIEEVDAALHPVVHERTVSTTGTIICPTTDPATWAAGTDLDISHLLVGAQPLRAARRFADGYSTWLLRRATGPTKWLLFDRPAGSERDLVVLARTVGATLVQRDSRGIVRVVGPGGVLRWERYAWHHEPPIRAWITDVTDAADPEQAPVLEAMAVFAVHDLAARGVGALLIHRAGADEPPSSEDRLPEPPELSIRTAAHLAPLRHALAQLDGAAFFDGAGTLRRLGVRLVPSAEAEAAAEPLRGTRHTSGRRYSWDDPTATVIAVSEDGPVTVLRGGQVLATSVPRR